MQGPDATYLAQENLRKALFHQTHHMDAVDHIRAGDRQHVVVSLHVLRVILKLLACKVVEAADIVQSLNQTKH